MSMLLDDIVSDYKASLQDAANAFTATSNADYVRHINIATAAMYAKRPRLVRASINLTAGVAEYDAPADMIDVHISLWRPAQNIKPWDSEWPGPMPALVKANVAGSLKIALNPPPTAQQISVMGSVMAYEYNARHVVGNGANETTISADDRWLLILRAQIEAMKELAMRNMTKPVQVRGVGNAPANGSPSAVLELLQREWKAA